MTTNKQIALVTGANKGIGFETARQLAQRGFIVWLGCRDEGRGVAAARALSKDGDVRFVRLDVTDDESVRAAASHVERETGALDVLVNNAGIFVFDGEGAVSTLRLETMQRTFEVNLFGVLRVTQAFLPLVRKSSAGRVVNVGSTLGSIATLVAPNSFLRERPAVGYSVSKTALSSVTAWLAVELRDTAIKVNVVCPGYNATDLNNHMGTQHPSEGAKVVVRAATLGDEGPTGTFLDVNGTVGW